MQLLLILGIVFAIGTVTFAMQNNIPVTVVLGFWRYDSSLAVVLLVAAVWHLLRSAAPLVALRVLQVRTLRITVSAGSLYRMVITAVPFLLPLQFQLEFGWTPFAAGLMVAALYGAGAAGFGLGGGFAA